MNLLETRKIFRQISGRYDLVDSSGNCVSGTNRLADVYINSGQRWLDHRQDTPQSHAWHTVKMSAGDFWRVSRLTRVIKDVWLVTDDDGITSTPLHRLSYAQMREQYPKLYESLDSTLRPPIVMSSDSDLRGTPLYWTPIVTRVAPDQADWTYSPNTDSRLGMDHVLMGDTGNYRGVMILPAPDTTIAIRIYGIFYSPWLAADSDTSYWTMEHQLTLVYAACLRVEESMRNSEGARDWEAAIARELVGIDKDLAEDDSSHITHMGER